MLETVREIICDYVECEPEDITENASLRYDIKATSFDLMNIAVEIEGRFNFTVPDSELPKIKTVGDIVKLLEGKV